MNDIKNSKIYSQKTILIIVLLIIVGILGITLCCLHIWTTAKDNGIVKVETKDSTKNSTIQDILEKHECTNISFAIKTSDDDSAYYKIFVRFKYNLYDGSESKKDYFDGIIKELSGNLKYSFELNDEKKDIKIFYDKDSKEYTINGVENYFKNNNFLEVKNYEVIPRIYADRNSNELSRIINSDWKRDSVNLEGEPISLDSEWIDYGDFKMNYTGRNINYVVFLESYKEEITNGILVGESFDKIKEELGTPTFKDSNKMIGYKTSDAYMFFYKDKFVAYPCMDYTNISFEEKIFKYLDKEYEGRRTNFVLEMKDEFIDIDSEMFENGVRLYSYSRGVELYLYNDGTMDIVLYNNYNFSDKLKPLARDGKVKLKLDTDYIFLFEVKRNS